MILAKKRASRRLGKDEAKVLQSFGQRLKAFREKKGLSVYDVTGEDMLIRSRQHWQKIESGTKNVNLTTVVKLAETLEVSSSELLRNI